MGRDGYFLMNQWLNTHFIHRLVAGIPTARSDDGNREAAFSAQKQALSALQPYVGQWRGVGQPRRGSKQGAWVEESNWAWQFGGDGPRLVCTLKDAKWYSALVVSSVADGRKDEARKRFVLIARQTDNKEDRFDGTLEDDGKLVLVRRREEPNRIPATKSIQNDEDGANRPARITFRLLAENNRMAVLYERDAGKDEAGNVRYARLAEVGSTRRGSDFAKGSGGPECIVTGGLGTIEVQHQGRTYFVCCTGCREAFNDDPEAVLAEYQDRKAAEKKKAAAVKD